MNNNVLYLSKCAYIFDDYNTTYFYGTRADYERKQGIIKALKEYYDNAEKRAEGIPYIVTDVCTPVIEINGTRHALNALQVARIEGELSDNVINYRKHVTPDQVAGLADAWRVNVYNDSFTLYNKKLASFYIEFFTDAESLGYIRANFNGRRATFIIDSRNGELFTAGERGIHTPTTVDNITLSLVIKSKAAKTALHDVLTAAGYKSITDK